VNLNGYPNFISDHGFPLNKLFFWVFSSIYTETDQLNCSKRYTYDNNKCPRMPLDRAGPKNLQKQGFQD
jgi:hypothetical protein